MNKIALVDCNPKAKRYNIGLLKIGAWLKEKGHFCKLFSNTVPQSGYDEIWISTLFSFHIPEARKLIDKAKQYCDKVKVGGIAASLLPQYFEDVETHNGVIWEAEQYIPDYRLLDYVPRYSVTRTHYGCIRKCGFCMVSRLEPEFLNRPNWERDIHRASTQVDFYDNNWLAKDWNGFSTDVQKLREITRSGRINRLDFSQALDCRLVTSKIAQSLSGLPIKPVRFSFDGMHEDGHFQSAIEHMCKAGFKSFTIYVLWNWIDTPQDFYYRLKECHRLSQELSIQVVCFPMRYQPNFIVDQKRDHTGKHWTAKMKKAFSASFMYSGGTKGQVSLFGKKGKMSPVNNFEFWFGKTGDEFVEILNQDKVREHWRFKQGLLNAYMADIPKPQSWHKFWDEFQIGT